MWSVCLRRCALKTRVDSAGRALAYSPSGDQLAVGLGGDKDAMVKEGAVMVLSAETLEVLEEVKKPARFLLTICPLLESCDASEPRVNNLSSSPSATRRCRTMLQVQTHVVQCCPQPTTSLRAFLPKVRNAKSWISDIKYAADGSLMAVASSGGQIYLYDASDHYRLRATTGEATSALKSGVHLRVNSTAINVR